MSTLNDIKNHKTLYFIDKENEKIITVNLDWEGNFHVSLVTDLEEDDKDLELVSTESIDSRGDHTYKLVEIILNNFKTKWSSIYRQALYIKKHGI